jgi:hypothetical protein
MMNRIHPCCLNYLCISCQFYDERIGVILLWGFLGWVGKHVSRIYFYDLSHVWIVDLQNCTEPELAAYHFGKKKIPLICNLVYTI